MANEEHLKILTELGHAQWSAWREGIPKERPDLSGVDFRNGFSHVNFRGIDFHDADLRRAKLQRASLNASRWDGALLGRTNLDAIRFDANHNVMHDGTDRLKYPMRDRVLNWSILRFIGRFPLFSVSWSALTISILVVNVLGFLNSAAAAGSPVFEGMTYPIPIPRRMMLI